MDPMTWLLGDDTGLSSITILSVITGWPCLQPARPRDPDDLGRCLRLLSHFPEWRERLPEVAVAYPEWGPLVREWNRLEGLFVGEGRSLIPARGTRMRKTYAAMKALDDECMAAGGWKQTGPGSWERPERSA